MTRRSQAWCVPTWTGPAGEKRADRDADVGQRAQVGAELLRAVAAVAADDRRACGLARGVGAGRRAHRDDERPEGVCQQEPGRGQPTDDEGGRVDPACAAAVRQMPDPDRGGEHDDPGEPEPQPHLAGRQVGRLGEVQHARGEVDATADSRTAAKEVNEAETDLA